MQLSFPLQPQIKAFDDEIVKEFSFSTHNLKITVLYILRCRSLLSLILDIRFSFAILHIVKKKALFVSNLSLLVVLEI